MQPPTPYLSIVCTLAGPRRDPRWLRQTRDFLAATCWQAAAFGMPIEILLVDWAEPRQVPAEKLLGASPANDHATIQVLSVPKSASFGAEPALLSGFDRERRAQNIGIRRARGEFILAAGTDIVPSGALIRFLAAGPLSARCVYTALCCEMTAPEPDARPLPPDAIEAACRRRVTKAGLYPISVPADGASAAGSEESWRAFLQGFTARTRIDDPELGIEFSPGNFLLMARSSWHELGGFPEWNLGDRHFDHMLATQARYRGFESQMLPSAAHYFAVPALRAPDVERDLYVDAFGDPRIRVESPILRNLLFWQSRAIGRAIGSVVPDREPKRVKLMINGPDWGLAGQDLETRDLPARSPVA